MTEGQFGDGRRREDNSGFKTHAFSLDPFERFRLALKRRPVSRKAAAIGAVGLVSAVLIGATVIGSGGGEATVSAEAQTKRLAELNADVARREQQVADLERRRSAAESEILDSRKRISALEARRADLQRQVAELTAPVAPTGGEPEAANDLAAKPDGRQADAAVDESAPPDETSTPDHEFSASSRPAQRKAAPSSAATDAAPVETAAIESPQAGGPLRVFIHVRSSDRAAVERARAVAAELERRGVSVAEIRGVVRRVPRDMVRFFYDADRDAVSALSDAVRQASPPDDPAPQTQDFRGYRAPPRQGTLELWLS